ncbi:MAG: indole-3-glycerol phosphate synthase TrpC, partial [Actinomycetota bacterium]
MLAKIVENKATEIATRKRETSQEALTIRADFMVPARDFRGALAKKGLSLIAEIKKASPSRGVLSENLEPGVPAVAYETAGADAISVVTDRRFFAGGLDDMVIAKAVTHVPVLRKDFIVDDYQIYEAKAFGADAILLITGILDDQTLGSFLSLCGDLGLAALVEAHTEDDVARALSAGADIIGLNNRDLSTFETDITTTERLMLGIPEEIVTVSESGIHGGEEAARLQATGVDALLVGEALMTANNIERKVQEIKMVGAYG